MKFINRLFLATAVALVIVNGSALAEESPKPSKPMARMGYHHGMGMGMGMMAGLTDEEKDQHIKAMQEHMLKLHELSNQILAEKDTAKQEELKAQQRQLMKEHFEKMKQVHHKK